MSQGLLVVLAGAVGIWVVIGVLVGLMLLWESADNSIKFFIQRAIAVLVVSAIGAAMASCIWNTP